MKEEKINKEKEYRKLFMYQKRWAKHWITATAHRAHSSTMFMTEPAKKTLEKINRIEENKKITNYEKINLLIEFYRKMDEKEKQVKNRMYNHYYFDAYQYLKRENQKVERGEEATIYKMPKA